MWLEAIKLGKMALEKILSSFGENLPKVKIPRFAQDP
jgi:hypothetical protein